MLDRLWRAYRPPAADVAIAAACVVFGQFVTWTAFEGPDALEGSRAANAVLNAVMMAALAWRRRAPLAALSWMVGVYFLTVPVFPHDVSFFAGAVPLCVATASAAYYSQRRRALLAAGLALLSVLSLALALPEFRSADGLLWTTGFLLVPWLMARGLREREERAAALGADLAEERSAKETALSEAVTDERARIARELHDIVAHSVSVMVVQVGAARTHLPAGATRSETSLLAAEEVGRQALADLRRLLGVMRTEDAADSGSNGESQPPQPGLSQLDALVDQARATGLDVEVQVDGEPGELPPGVDLTAYRVVQESLTNTLRHSGAAKATVRLVYSPSSLLLEIADDGTREAEVNGGGHGLVGISERVSLFGGRATTGRIPGGGWQVRAELPTTPNS